MSETPRAARDTGLLASVSLALAAGGLTIPALGIAALVAGLDLGSYRQEGDAVVIAYGVVLGLGGLASAVSLPLAVLALVPALESRGPGRVRAGVALVLVALAPFAWVGGAFAYFADLWLSWSGG